MSPIEPSDQKHSLARKPTKQPRAGMVGPLFSWELVRLARRGQDFRARFVLAVSLLVVLTLFTVFWFPHVPLADVFTGTAQVLSIQDSARFANNFALTIALTQLAVLCLLTPAYAAGGIAEEKEKKTFPFLLITELTPHEIVFGKFLGRLVFLLGVMLAGLPVLALTLLYGGVSIRFLLISYLLTGTTVALLAAIGVASAAFAETFRGALFRSYGLAALHVCAGCGMHPFLSPFGIVAFIYRIEAESPRGSLITGLVYGSLQLLFALIAVVMAMRAVRIARATPVHRPPARSRDRGDRGLQSDRKVAKVSPDDTLPEVVAPISDELVLMEMDTERAMADPLPVTARVTPRPANDGMRDRDRPRNWDDDSGDHPRRRRRQPLPPEVARRPAVNPDDPFWWKEWYVAPSKRDADDESIRGVMIAVGVVVGLTLGFFALIAVIAVVASDGSRESLGAAQRLLILGGGAGMFTHLLMVGSAAGGSVCRERQRLTLESLLMIPVDRRRILWPKWLVSLTKGGWWGAPATGCVALGLLASESPLLGFAAVLFLAACAPFAASFGLWLSVRCKTVTRAILWFLPAAGMLTLVPVFVWWGTNPREAWIGVGVLTCAGVGVAIGAVAFWQLAWTAFEREGRE